MEIKINGKNFEITPAIGSYAEKRFVKLTKYFDGLLEIHINLIKEGKGNHFAAEVSIFGDGVVLHSEDRQEDLYQSIDMVVDKLERQLKKYKDTLYGKLDYKIYISGECQNDIEARNIKITLSNTRGIASFNTGESGFGCQAG